MAATTADRPPVTVDVGKAVLLTALIGSATFLAAIDVLAAELVATMFVTILGYLLGNGVVALKGRRGLGLVTAHPDQAVLSAQQQTNQLLLELFEQHPQLRPPDLSG